MAAIVVVDKNEVPGTGILAGQCVSDGRKLGNSGAVDAYTLPPLEGMFNLHVVPSALPVPPAPIDYPPEASHLPLSQGLFAHFDGSFWATAPTLVTKGIRNVAWRLRVASPAGTPRPGGGGQRSGGLLEGSR